MIADVNQTEIFPQTFMASEDIIQHIIRDIVAKSSVILRQEKTNATQLVLDSDTIAKDVFVGGILSYNQNTILVNNY